MKSKKNPKKTKDPKKVAWGKEWSKINKEKIQNDALNSVKPSINKLNQRVNSLESRKPSSQTKIVTQVVHRTDLNIPIKFSLFEKIFGVKIPLVEIRKEESSKNKTFTLNRILRKIGVELNKLNSRLNIHRKDIDENKILIEKIQKDRKKEKKEFEKRIIELEEKILNLESEKK